MQQMEDWVQNSTETSLNPLSSEVSKAVFSEQVILNMF